MWTSAGSFGRTVALVLLTSAVQTTRLGRHLKPHSGHGVAEGNGPTGLNGFFGCLFSYAVCQQNERCVNDNLFGSCQRIGTSIDTYQYHLKEYQIRQLELEIERLVEAGFKWRDLYTQCVIGNVLLAFELNQHYDSEFCRKKPPTKPHLIPTEVLTTDNDLFPLEKSYQDIPNADRGPGADFLDYDNNVFTKKKSENPYVGLYDRSLSDPEKSIVPLSTENVFVNIHKYQKSKKHLPLDDPATRRSNSKRIAQEDFLRSLSPKELNLLTQIITVDAANDGRDQIDGGLYDDEEEEEREDNEDSGPSLLLPIVEEQNQDQVDSQPEDYPEIRTRSDTDDRYIVEPESGESEQEVEEAAPEDSSYNTDVLSALMLLQNPEYDWHSNKEQSREIPDYYDDSDNGSVEDKGVARDPADDDVDLNRFRHINYAGATDLSPNEEKLDNYADNLMDAVMSMEQIPNPEAIQDDNSMEEPRQVRGSLVTSSTEATTTKARYDVVKANYAYLSVLPKTTDLDVADTIVTELQELLQLPPDSFSDLSVHEGDINFRINPNPRELNASSVAVLALSLSNELKNRSGYQVVGAGVGHVSEAYISVDDVKPNGGRKYFLLTFVLCGVIAGVVLAVILLYVIRRHRLSKEKLVHLAQSTEKVGPEASKDYQELCRHHMQSKLSEKPEPLHVAGRVGSVSAIENAPVHSPSSRSSTSSWSEEPVTTSMDISTGHIILSYMEDHLKNKDRLDEEWEALCAYEPEICAVAVGTLPQNERKNRYGDILPYDHSRVVLHSAANMTGSDYINASTITDHDPRNPAYIVTQGPLPNTVADFWQMVWEQGCVVIVNLTKLTEQGNALCHCYWPSEGSDLYHIYEVHLVSEHIWCEDYLVRSFYLKNLQTNETRTVTQFHFLTWLDMKIPGTSKALLDFRRKVNKSYRGRSCPILVQCSDGAGRSGTYCLIDMVLNRMTKGAKEIDIAATLEHIRDQRMQMVKTKEQFQFVLATVAEEVHAILKALPQ